MRFDKERDEALSGLSQQVRSQLDRILAEAQQDRPAPRLLNAMITELGVTIEELMVAEEEMRVQNDALGAAGQSLEAERQRYRDLFEFAPDPYLVTDLSGVVLEANQAAFTLLGLGPRSLIKKPLVVFVSPGDRLAFHTELTTARQAGSRSRQASEAQEYEITLQPRKGPAVSVLARTALIRDTQGQPAAMRWLLRDNTARRLGELERYRQIIEGVHDYAIFTLDLEGKITGWNAGAQRLLGYSPAEAIGQPGAIIFTPEDRAAGAPAAEIAQASAEGRALDERWHLRKDGSRFWGSGTMMALSDDRGALLSLAKVIRDGTALHSGQQREEAAAAPLQAAPPPGLPRETPGLGLAFFHPPAWEEAGGGFADVSRPENGGTALVVGSMAGKGREAAAQAAALQNMLRFALYRERTVKDAVGGLNRLVIGQELLSGSAALFAGLFDERAETLTYVNCGQEPALVWHAATGDVEELGPTGPPLGLQADAEFEQQTVRVSPGDSVAVFTDGLAGAAALLKQHSALLPEGTASEKAAELAERLMADALSSGLARSGVCLLAAVAGRP